ncbi:MAG: PEGA domain-containing protein [Acidobacteria bacterium]|nr:PEGA domain-containing protein [Acidobacteriota bacterium]
MRPTYWILMMLVAAPAAARAQDAEQRDAAPQAEAPSPEPERQAIPRGSRPQGENPRTGTAIPRRAPSPGSVRPDGRPGDRGRIAVAPDNYFFYPRRAFPYRYGAYPYGYGAFGLRFYDDPYRWSPGGYSPYGYGGYPGRTYSALDIGELRLDVSPRHAQVFVDGYYAGVVDDFDGAFQALKLESGAYRIELIAPGYETLAFDVRMTPGQRIRYRGDLRRN